MEFMQITGYTDESFSDSVSEKPYSFMLNPDTIKWTRSIEYNSEQSLGTIDPAIKYKSTPADKLSFDIVIDCTGLVKGSRTDMVAEINQITEIVSTFNGEIHRPNFVKLQWGNSLMFNGVLDSLDTMFTLFKPDGTPLRAKISLSFSSYIAPSLAAKIENKKSPDITHVVNVVEGMSLPQLCNKVWKDDSKCIQLARYNDLNKFRNLKGIEKIVFPPIIQQN